MSLFNIMVKKGKGKTQVETFIKLAPEPKDLRQTGLPRDALDTLKTIKYKLTPNRNLIREPNKDDIKSIKRSLNGMRLSKHMLEKNLLLPNDRYYDKNKQGFLFYANKSLYQDVATTTTYMSFMKPRREDIKQNSMKNKLYIITTKYVDNVTMNYDVFKNIVNQFILESKKSSIVNVLESTIGVLPNLKNILLENMKIIGRITKPEKPIKINNKSSKMTVKSWLKERGMVIYKINIDRLIYDIEDRNIGQIQIKDFYIDIQDSVHDIAPSGFDNHIDTYISPFNDDSQQFYPIHSRAKNGKTYTELHYDNDKFLETDEGKKYNPTSEEMRILGIDKKFLIDKKRTDNLKKSAIKLSRSINRMDKQVKKL
jgi:hypothetical protein